MKIARKFSLAATAVLATALLLASSYVVGATVTSQGFVEGNASNEFLTPFTQGHATQAENVVDNDECIECHTSTIPGKALRGKKTAHNVHLKSMWLRFGKMYETSDEGLKINTGCIYCHPDTAYANYSSVGSTAITTGVRGRTPGAASNNMAGICSDCDPDDKIRRQVNPDFCSRCHSKFNVYGGDHGGIQPTGCTNGTACHQNWAHELGTLPEGTFGTKSAQGFDMINAKNADTSASTGRKADSYCLRCHGGKAWYQTLDPNYVGTADALTP